MFPFTPIRRGPSTLVAHDTMRVTTKRRLAARAGRKGTIKRACLGTHTHAPTFHSGFWFLCVCVGWGTRGLCVAARRAVCVCGVGTDEPSMHWGGRETLSADSLGESSLMLGTSQTSLAPLGVSVCCVWELHGGGH